ncbi:hypothetical protein [Aeromicrobium phragmitis]|uniref:hypothetical protein n=1 Tax=Aeromicrobium phragmitis TaxID=2478914 RepID=UPI00105BCECF|nr:hypothetical protein [Aeromicrobium phragmitis]
MTSRRTLITGAVAVGGVIALGATDTLDDVVRAVGVEPRPRPRASDVSLMRAVLDDQQRLLSIALGTPGADDAVALLSAQVTQLGGRPTTSLATGDLAAELSAAAEHRAADASGAVAPDVAMVLASMSAGLGQLAERRRGGRG